MRVAAWLPALALAVALLPTLALGQAEDVGGQGVDGLVQPAGPEAQSAGVGVPPVGGDPGAGTGNPAPPGSDPTSSPAPLPEGTLDLGPLEIDPEMGLGIAVGVGVSLVGLGLASLLGTRFVNAGNVLENDARRAIFEYIKTNPGCHLRETAGALQLSTTNVLWHLRKLEEANLVNGKKLEGYKVFYPVEGGVEAKRMGLALAVLRNPNARQVLGIIARNPGIHQREIARIIGVNHGTVRWHLKKLGVVQLVLEVKKGSVAMYYVSALGLQALERVEQARPAEPPQPPPLAEVAEVAPTVRAEA